MKHLLLTCCLLLAGTARAQKNSAPLPAAPIVYCLLVVDGSYFSSVSLSLDYGQQQGKSSVQDAALAEAASQVRRFTSVPACLNYLHSLGWECVQSATLPNETSSHYVQGQIGYLLRRRTP